MGRDQVFGLMGCPHFRGGFVHYNYNVAALQGVGLEGFCRCIATYIM